MIKPTEWRVYDMHGCYGNFSVYENAIGTARWLAEHDEFVEVVAVTYTPVNFKKEEK